MNSSSIDIDSIQSDSDDNLRVVSSEQCEEEETPMIREETQFVTLEIKRPRLPPIINKTTYSEIRSSSSSSDENNDSGNESDDEYSDDEYTVVSNYDHMVKWIPLIVGSAICATVTTLYNN